MNKPLSIPAHVAWRRVENEVVVLDLESSVYWTLNEAAARIWELLAEGRSQEQIVAALCEEFDVKRAGAQRDVEKVIAELRSEKVLAATAA